MKTFFVILMFVGAIYVALNVEANRTSDSIPTELANHGTFGLGLIGFAVLGLICLFVADALS